MYTLGGYLRLCHVNNHFRMLNSVQKSTSTQLISLSSPLTSLPILCVCVCVCVCVCIVCMYKYKYIYRNVLTSLLIHEWLYTRGKGVHTYRGHTHRWRGGRGAYTQAHLTGTHTHTVIGFEEVCDHKASTQNRVTCYPIAPVLQLLATLLNKVLTIATIVLLIGERGEGVECELGREPLVEPIVMLVATTDNGSFTTIRGLGRRKHTWNERLGNYSREIATTREDMK